MKNTTYQPKIIEPKWQKFWEENQTFATTDDTSKPKYYVLSMFPYPSGNGLHVGHVLGYTATDIVARFKKANNFNVLHPMGWDAFGLPAEQHAEMTNTHPEVSTQQNIANFKKQLQQLGYSYDWNREINTSQPDYYRWTQFLFSKLYEKGLAYLDEVPVNWCPALRTVLANEEVIDGRSERGGHPVYRKPMLQWMLKITAYAERLLDDLDTLDWPDSLKEMQRHWIGKSEGAEAHFKVENEDDVIRVFTTRPDTLFGATYLVLAPEHPLVAKITTEEQKEAVLAYQKETETKNDRDRTIEKKEKTGVFTGAYAINPTNQKRVPIWIADYVLNTYGTGAIMAVPAHDTRDWEFAKTFNLDIIEVVEGGNLDEAAYTNDGVSVNSDFLNGLKTQEAKEKMLLWLEENGCGKRHIQYKLRDWLFSRQRYWGEPFPIVHQNGQHFLIDESELPLTLPKVEYPLPDAGGVTPLSNITEWVETTYKGAPALRETNTMPQWAGSCWYYLRYIDPHNTNAPWDPEKEKYWMNVDLYVGGAEHAVLHLLYARFWHKVFYDCGLVSTIEPFQRIINQGMILGQAYEYYLTEDGKPISYHEKSKYDYVRKQSVHNDDVVWKDAKPMHPEYDIELFVLNDKMSKSRGNVINPSDVIEEYGADALRLYEMFMGPLEQYKPWDDTGVSGTFRFLTRVWRLVCDPESLSKSLVETPPEKELERELHETIKKVTQDTEEYRFNTAIAKLMEFTNTLYKCDNLPKCVLKTVVQLLSPYAPHLAEELWEVLGGSGSVANQTWPTWNDSLLVASTYKLPVQVMGKLRATIDVPVDCDQETAVERAKENEHVHSFLDGKTVRKIIFVPGRILNFVVS